MAESIDGRSQILQEELKRWSHEYYFWLMFSGFSLWTLSERLKYGHFYGDTDYSWGLLGQLGAIVLLLFMCSHTSDFAKEVWDFRLSSKGESEIPFRHPARKHWEVNKCFWLTILTLTLWQICCWTLEQTQMAWWHGYLGVSSGIGLFFLLGRGRLFRCFTDIEDSFRLMQQSLLYEQEQDPT